MRILFAFSLLFLISESQAQTRSYLGLTGIHSAIRPEFTIYKGYLYIESSNGLFRKSLSTSGTEWDKISPDDASCMGYVLNGDTILITTNNGEDQCLWLSTDNGITWQNHTHGFAGSGADFSEPSELVQHPSQPSLIYGMAGDCVAKSIDFGNTWTPVKNDWGYIAYQPIILRINPTHPNQVISGGEAGNFHSYLDISFDGGSTWSRHAYEDNNAVNCIEFHPTNPAILYIGKEGWIDRSVDSGQTWTRVFQPGTGLYFQAIDHPYSYSDDVYATGLYNSVPFEKDTIHVFKSTNQGVNWSSFHQEYIPGCGGADEMEIHDSIMYIKTPNKGIYSLNLRALSTGRVRLEALPLYTWQQNTSSLSLKSLDNGELTLAIIDLSGKKLYSSTSVEHQVPIFAWNHGVYLAQITQNGTNTSKKFLVQ